jgi:hypothetical protein
MKLPPENEKGSKYNYGLTSVFSLLYKDKDHLPLCDLNRSTWGLCCELFIMHFPDFSNFAHETCWSLSFLST